jgi:hypothetical protein
MNRFAHKHGKVEKIDAATKPGRHGRARSPGEVGVLRCSKRVVISIGNHALRGAVNWGAEKNMIVTNAELERKMNNIAQGPG